MSGVDTAERLVEIAAASAAAEGLPASFSIADAKALPFEDATFDVIVSVMGIIFAPDAPRALSEALRVLRPGGRAFLSAWCPGGAIDAMIGVMVSGVAEVLGPPPARFRWGDAGEVRVLAQELGSEASVHDGTLSSPPSPRRRTSPSRSRTTRAFTGAGTCSASTRPTRNAPEPGACRAARAQRGPGRVPHNESLLRHRAAPRISRPARPAWPGRGSLASIDTDPFLHAVRRQLDSLALDYYYPAYDRLATLSQLSAGTSWNIPLDPFGMYTALRSMHRAVPGCRS